MLPPPGKHWQYTPEMIDAMDARGDIYWSKNGNPRRKVYFEGSAGVAVQDIWLDCRDVHNQNTKITGYPTEKPPALVRRIIEASSNPGDWVLDCYAGSGTALDVASELGRRWIGIDNSVHAIETTLRRFSHGLQPMGDYVALRNGKPDKPQQLALTVQDGERPYVLPTGREPLRDFALIAEESVARDLAPDVLVRFWPWYTPEPCEP
jgi:adenine-specific DNA-methyltransferase